jgi:CheY-like chemotaxis protein
MIISPFTGKETKSMHKAIKILMVDDEAQFRATTQKILNKKGFDTVLAASGEEALDKLVEGPDVVILDIKMPGMDGHDVLKEIRKRKPDLPVIMLTGHGQAPSAREAKERGAYDYLTKPCDINLLTAKILEAYHFARVDRPEEEKTVRDVMVSISDYTTITEDQTIAEAIKKLRESYSSALCTSRLMETGHRSIIVFDTRGKMKGLLAIADLLKAIMPGYLSAPKPSTADSIQYSPMFWGGAFNREVKLLAKKKVKEIMSPAPMTINDDANLMEAAYSMVTQQIRRMVVLRQGEVVGVLREQDLFFEIEHVLGAQ